MNEEKNNVGVNNSLPPMGNAVIDNSNTGGNIQDKYGLPPITNFTNFNDNYNVPNTDNNVSVFDLMNQFETVNPNNNVNTTNNNIDNNPNSVVDQSISQQNNANDIPSIFGNPFGPSGVVQSPQLQVPPASPTPAVPQMQVPPASPTPAVPQMQVPPASPTPVVPQMQVPPASPTPAVPQMQVPPASPTPVAPQTQTPSVNTPNGLNMFNGAIANQNINLNQQGVSGGENQNVVPETIENASVQDNNSVDEFVNEPPASITQDSGLFTNNPSSKQNIVANDEDSLENPDVVPPMVNNITADFGLDELNSGDDGIVEIETTSIEEDGESISSFDTNGKEEKNDNSDNKDDKKDEDVDLNEIASENTLEKPNDQKNVKKDHKLLFIILAAGTFVLIVVALLLAYFMFFKTDKLVCGLQDYSNDEFLLEESMVAKFKGNKMTTANLTQTLTFTKENLEKKDSYLEELKNQYQGLGFSVKFEDNEEGFEISMDFTKEELENWYGANIKNSSKEKLKKEMRESGYTCK